MNQIEKDAIILRQIFEKIIEVLYDNDVMYSKENIARMSQILMAFSVNMMGMSSNNVAEFRTKAQKMVDGMATMLDTMDPNQRGKLMQAVDEQIGWFEKVYEKQKKDFEEDQETFSEKEKMN